MVNAMKTGQRRNVRLLAPLVEDLQGVAARAGLAERRTRWCSRARTVSRGRWRPTRAGRARRRADASARTAARGPAARARSRGRRSAAGVPTATPYTLRHSFCSLLLHEGRSVIYVARQLGHDAKLTLSTYGHVIDELEDAPRVPAEDAIRAARVARVSLVCHGRRRRDACATGPENAKTPGCAGASVRSPLPDSNRRPLPYHGSALPTELRGRSACKSGLLNFGGPRALIVPVESPREHGSARDDPRP